MWLMLISALFILGLVGVAVMTFRWRFGDSDSQTSGQGRFQQAKKSTSQQRLERLEYKVDLILQQLGIDYDESLDTATKFNLVDYQEPEETEAKFNVVLEKVPSRRKAAIAKVIRMLSAAPIEVVQEIVEDTPSIVLPSVHEEAARKAMQQLVDVGAGVSLRDLDNMIVEQLLGIDVVLEAVPQERKIAVLTVVCQLTGVSGEQAQDLLEQIPVVLFKQRPGQEAQAIAKKLQSAGAKVSLRNCVV